jgi:serine/threonine-protein kinase
MGEVYLAQHPRLPRRDALKVLPASVSADNEYRQRFNREADIAATLWHPHIVGVHDRGDFEGQLWISMDYVDGTDAARLMRERFPKGMAKAEVAEIVMAVAEALDYAHDATCYTATSSLPTSCCPTRDRAISEFSWRTSVSRAG